jgi:surface polysaccharide O-acyltransferase-like enzyme
MHTYGTFYGTATGINLIYGVLINSIFNTGVSIFVLISGYFGINKTIKKILQLEMAIIFYSVLSTITISFIQNCWDIKNIIIAFFPVISGKYWFITSYFLLLLFSNYLNKVPETLERKDFEKLLFLMFSIFSIIPTILQFHVMNDGGKGFANMLLMYYIGRYIRLYWNKKVDNLNRMCALLIGITAIGFSLNLILTIIRGGVGVYAPFARDCTCIIIIASILIFIVFKHLNIRSKLINRMAKHVIAVYLYENAMRTSLNCFFDITVYGEKWYLFMVINVYVIVIIVSCMFVDLIRSFISEPLEKIAYTLSYNLYKHLCILAKKYMNKIL